MRLIKKGAILLCIVLLIITVKGFPGDSGTDRSSSFLPMDTLYAQEPVTSDQIPRDKEQKSENTTTLYLVMAVILFIWLGRALFLFRLDRKVARLERQTKDLK